MGSVDEARQSYADRLYQSLELRSDRVRRAFATVPRERFLGPAPWTVIEVPWRRVAQETLPEELYRDVLVVIDAERRLNNGQPSLHAFLIDRLELRAGEHVVHVGTGTGYYTAILAAIVGPAGHVTAVEIDPELSGRTRENVSDLPQVEVHAANAVDFDPGWADAFYVCAGATHVPARWLERLLPGGRILLPLTSTAEIHTGGAFLLVTRLPDGFAARFVSPTGIYPCVGGRDPALDERLARAFQRGGWERVRRLRQDPHDTEPACWLHADDFCLSERDPGQGIG